MVPKRHLAGQLAATDSFGTRARRDAHKSFIFRRERIVTTGSLRPPERPGLRSLGLLPWQCAQQSCLFHRDCESVTHTCAAFDVRWVLASLSANGSLSAPMRRGVPGSVALCLVSPIASGHRPLFRPRRSLITNGGRCVIIATGHRSPKYPHPTGNMRQRVSFVVPRCGHRARIYSVTGGPQFSFRPDL